MTTEELRSLIDDQANLMVTVATGGPAIKIVQAEYTERRSRIAAELRRRGIEDPNPYRDLWRWHGSWSSGKLPTYASRRLHIAEMYDPLRDQLERLEAEALGTGLDADELTGGIESMTRWPS